MNTIGLIGLGKKGYPLAKALQKRRIKILGFDLTEAHRLRAANNGIVTTSSISGVVMHLPERKTILLVLEPDGEKTKIIDRLKTLLRAGDVIVDLGEVRILERENYRNLLKDNGIHLLHGIISNDKIEMEKGAGIQESDTFELTEI